MTEKMESAANLHTMQNPGASLEPEDTANGYQTPLASVNLAEEAVEFRSNIINTSVPGECPIVIVKNEPMDDGYEELSHVSSTNIWDNGHAESIKCEDTNCDGSIADKIKTEYSPTDTDTEVDVPLFFMNDTASPTDYFGNVSIKRQRTARSRERCDSLELQSSKKNTKSVLSIRSFSKKPFVYIDMASENERSPTFKKQCMVTKCRTTMRSLKETENIQIAKGAKKVETGKRQTKKKTKRNGRRKGKVVKKQAPSTSASNRAKRNKRSGKRQRADKDPQQTVSRRAEVTKIQEIETHFCDICSKEIIGSSQKIKRHKRNHKIAEMAKTQEIETHFCDICTKEITGSSQKIKRHIRYHKNPPSGKLLKCNLCPMVFRVQERFDGHMRTHRGEDAFVCSLCGKGFHYLSNLKGHMKSHTGEKPYKCELCGKAFAEASLRVRHLKTHIRKGELTLNGHSQSGLADDSNNDDSSFIHSKSILYKPYKCSICSKTFTRTVFMIQHVRDHENGKITLTGEKRRQFRLSDQVSFTNVQMERTEVEDVTREAAQGTPRDDDHVKDHESRNVTPNASDRKQLDVSDPECFRSVQVQSEGVRNECPQRILGDGNGGVVESSKKGKVANCSEARLTDKVLTGESDHVMCCDAAAAPSREEIAQEKRAAPSGEETAQEKIGAPSVEETAVQVKTGAPSGEDITSGNSSEGCHNSHNPQSTTVTMVKTEVEEVVSDGFVSMKFVVENMSDIFDKKVYPFQCAYCDELFSNERIIEGHVLLHTSKVVMEKEKVRDHTCEYCGKSFYKYGHLKAHVMIHTGERPYICEVCAKGFTESSKLTRHLKTHYNTSSSKPSKSGASSKKERKVHSCQYCGKIYDRLSRLTAHVMQHTGEKPYSCHRCGKRFCEAKSLTRHMKTHERNKDEWMSGVSSSEEEENEESDEVYPWEEEEDTEEMMDYEADGGEGYEEVNCSDSPNNDDTDDGVLDEDKDEKTELPDSVSSSDAEDNKTLSKKSKTDALQKRKRKISIKIYEDNCKSEDVNTNSRKPQVNECLDGSDERDKEEISEFMPFSGLQTDSSKLNKDKADDETNV